MKTRKVSFVFAFLRPQSHSLSFLDMHDIVDDEYANAGIEEPTILITTSRNPSSRLSQFAKEMRLVVPNAQKMNRGGHTIPEIIDACKSKGISDILVVHETRGQPGLFSLHSSGSHAR